MAIVPVVRTWKDAPDPESILTYKEYGESLFDPLEFLMNPPMCHVVNTSAITFTNGVFTLITYQKVIIDTHGFFNPSVNPGRVTPTVPGWYKGWYGTSFETAATGTVGRRIIQLARYTPPSSGVSISRRDNRGVANAADDHVIKGIRFHAAMNGIGQWFEVQAYQESGGTMTTTVNQIGRQTEFFVRWWKPL